MKSVSTRQGCDDASQNWREASLLLFNYLEEERDFRDMLDRMKRGQDEPGSAQGFLLFKREIILVTIIHTLWS